MITKDLGNNKFPHLAWPTDQGLGLRIEGHEGVGSKIRCIYNGIGQVFRIADASKSADGRYFVLLSPEK